MRRTLLIALSTLVMAALWTPAASASGNWHFGTAFRIGDVHFQIGFHDDHHDRYYYRTRVDVGRHYYGRAHRSRGCHVRNGYHYHGSSCPLVHSYIRDHGYHHDSIFARHAPGYGHRGHGYQSHRGRSHRDHGYGNHRGRGHRDHGYGNHRGRGRDHRGHADRHRHRDRRHNHRHHGNCPYH